MARYTKNQPVAGKASKVRIAASPPSPLAKLSSYLMAPSLVSVASRLVTLRHRPPCVSTGQPCVCRNASYKFIAVPASYRWSSLEAGRVGSSRLIGFCSKDTTFGQVDVEAVNESEAGGGESGLRVQVGSPAFPLVVRAPKMSLGDQAFFLLAFIACTTCVAFTSLVVAAIPTIYAMGRAATSLSKLADTAREELPSTMAAIRLSGMEISDLTLELSDLSQEIADGVSKSAQAVQAAEAGIRQIGALARQQTVSIIQERASLPIISLQPVVAGAARKTSRAVGRARKTFMNIISKVESRSEDEEYDDEIMES